jgi:thermitase
MERTVNPSALSRIFPFAGFLLALASGCAGSRPAPVLPAAPASAPASAAAPVSAPAGRPAPPVPASAGRYVAYQPVSEEDLQAHTHYGYVIAKAGPGFDERLLALEGFETTATIRTGDATYYHLHRAGPVLPSLARLQNTRGILFAHPDLKLVPFGGIPYSDPDPLTPAEEYSVYLTRAMSAWTVLGFGPSVPVLVDVDTGVNWAHEDFQVSGASKVIHAWSWWDLATGAFIDGSSDPAAQPIDYLGTATTSTDEDSHGSHTMGTLGAIGDNGKGVAGVCWPGQLISYKCFNDNDPVNSGSEWAIYGSVYHLVNWKKETHDEGTIPVNMSLGGTWAEPFDVDMIQLGLANGVVIVAAMGNDGQELPEYPAAYAGVIAVGATDGLDRKCVFSDSGEHISVCAPGLDIISTGNAGTSDYFIDSGTSMATPFVTGLLGYMLTFQPALTPAQLKTEVETFADPIQPGGFNIATGHGRVDVFRTIEDVSSRAQIPQGYAGQSLVVTVEGTLSSPAEPIQGLPVYLYHSDASGGILDYVACAITDGQGTVAFGLLPGDDYVAMAILGGQAFATPVVQVTPTDEAIPPVVLDLPVTFAQFLPDAGPLQLSSAQIIAGDAQGDILGSAFGTLPLVLPLVLGRGASCLLNVQPYSGSYGEYALCVSPSLYPAATAPGSFATSPHAGSASQSRTDPQVIQGDTLYNADLGAQADWYQYARP